MKQINITFLLTVLMSMVGAKVSAHDISVKNADGVTIYYNWNSDKTELAVSYRGISASYSNEYSDNVVIPSSVTYDGKEYSVTSIGRDAFWSCKRLTSVEIPSSVTSIGDNAFEYCSRLTSVEIPNSVTTIGSSAFSGCSGLKVIVKDIAAWCNIQFGTDSSNPLSYAHHLYSDEYTEIKDLVIPNGVTSIGNFAFYGCSGLTSVEIPNSVTSIGNYAFFNTNLNSVTIGSGVLSIGSNAFSYSVVFNGARPLKVIWLTNTPPSGYEYVKGTMNYVANDLYTGLKNTTVYPFLSSMFDMDGVKYVPVSPSERTCDAIDCVYDESASNIHIGNNVMYKGVAMTLNEVKPSVCEGNQHIKTVLLDYNGDIPANAFYGCGGLQTVTISNQGNIGENAFASSIISSKLDVNNVGDIATSAFANITGEFDATINNAGNLGNEVFKGSTGLKNLQIGASVKNINNEAFFGCTGLQKATISSQGNIGESAFNGCTGLQTATILNQGYIGESAFNGCMGLQKATIGKNVTSIGNKAFYKCTQLQSIDIPDAVKSLGTESFSGCTELISAKIGKGVSAIYSSAFSGCSTLESVQIGSNVETIGSSAFESCPSLSTIMIPQSVSEISDNAFKGCSGIKEVIMEDGKDDSKVLTLGSNGSSPIFSDCPLDTVYIGRNISYSTASNKGYSPFYRNTTLCSVVITDKETEISPNEFYGCTNLKNVRIGDGVTTIGDWAFSGCSSLDYFAFGNSVKTIGKEAFSDCTAMTKLYSSAPTPPVCGTQALDDINKWNCTLTVPVGHIADYQAADQWKDFFFVEEGSAGIHQNRSNNARTVRHYDVNGNRLAAPQHGINIIKSSDGTTKKVLVK